MIADSVVVVGLQSPYGLSGLKSKI